MKDKSVFVVILNYNHIEDLKETIYSFLKQDYAKLHIVVSDNGSTDESISWLKKEHTDIVVLENSENLGWAEGNNVGIRYALKQNADYVLLANNDLSFDKSDIVTSLINAFSNIPSLGIFGPSENSCYKKSKLVNQGWIMFPKAKHCFNVNRNKTKNQNFPSQYKIIDNVSGSFMIIKRQVFEDVGEMDSKLFLYAEDADFSLRAWSKGWISAVNKEITIYHKISATSGNNSPLKIYYKTRNLIYIIRKHKEIQDSHFFFIYKYYFDAIKVFLKIVFKKEYSGGRLYKLKAHIQGFLHGAIFKRMGKFY